MEILIIGAGVPVGFLLAWLLGSSSKRAAVGELSGKLSGEVAKSEDLRGRLAGVEAQLRDGAEEEKGLRGEISTLSAKLSAEKGLVAERDVALAKVEARLADGLKGLVVDEVRMSQEQFLRVLESKFSEQEKGVRKSMDDRLASMEKLISEREEKSREKPVGDETMLEPSVGFLDEMSGGGFADVGGVDDGFEGFLAEGNGDGI